MTTDERRAVTELARIMAAVPGEHRRASELRPTAAAVLSPDGIAAVVRSALMLCDVDELLGWQPGTASKQRSKLPPADVQVGRTPLWARSTIERWRDHARPGQGRRTDLRRTETDA